MDEEMRQALFEICTIESSMVDLQVDKLYASFCLAESVVEAAIQYSREV